MQRTHPKAGLFVVALLACLIASGCSSSPRHGITIHDSPRGSVYLEQIPDMSFQATHPITLEAWIIARALRGIQVRDDRNTLQAFLSSRPEAVRAFSDQESDFLAPIISTALAKASPDQRIGFRINQAASPPDRKKEGAAHGPSGPAQALVSEEVTSGVLLAYGRSLQIHLTRFRSGIQPRSMIDGPNRHYVDQTGLTGRKLEFLPEEAQRPETFRVGETEFPALVIDYELLAKLPEPPAAPAPVLPAPARPDQPPAPAAATVEEVEALKKELQEIKRQLQEQQSKEARPKQKGKSSPAH
ncbi:MAG: hypothetical protein A3H49_00445 [Nitrospirae bacterium RIFCSPLOWO2_02_FULL_62_14]|nr:MAG: hypothetical protein A3H49_00445 [Nitrospirae bacterium RIFCSPLOWO2_02_FULL_62_14]